MLKYQASLNAPPPPQIEGIAWEGGGGGGGNLKIQPPPPEFKQLCGVWGGGGGGAAKILKYTPFPISEFWVAPECGGGWKILKFSGGVFQDFPPPPPGTIP